MVDVSLFLAFRLPDHVYYTALRAVSPGFGFHFEIEMTECSAVAQNSHITHQPPVRAKPPGFEIFVIPGLSATRKLCPTW